MNTGSHLAALSNGTSNRSDWQRATRMVGECLYRFAVRVAVFIRAQHRRRRTERELLALSDTALKDIGVSRSQIAGIAHGLEVSNTRRGHGEH